MVLFSLPRRPSSFLLMSVHARWLAINEETWKEMPTNGNITPGIGIDIMVDHKKREIKKEVNHYVHFLATHAAVVRA